MRRLRDLNRWATTTPVAPTSTPQPQYLWHFIDGSEKPIHHSDAREILGVDPPTTYGAHYVSTERGRVSVFTIPNWS